MSEGNGNGFDVPGDRMTFESLRIYTVLNLNTREFVPFEASAGTIVCMGRDFSFPFRSIDG